MRGEEKGCAAAADNFGFQETTKVRSGERVEAPRGLIEKKNGGRVNERAREAKALQCSGGIRTSLTVERLVQTKKIAKFADSLRDLGARKVVQRSEEAKVIAARKPAIKAFLDSSVVAYVSACVGGVTHDISAANFSAPARGKEQSGEHAQEGGLAGAVLTDQGDGLSRLDGKCNSAKRPKGLTCNRLQ